MTSLEAIPCSPNKWNETLHDIVYRFYAAIANNYICCILSKLWVPPLIVLIEKTLQG